MRRVAISTGLLVLLAAACGDNTEGPDDGDVLARLRALDGVTAEAVPTDREGFAYYVLRFTQPVDHANPGGPVFQQRVSLLHRTAAAPLVALTSGYWDYYEDSPVELTGLLVANQISIEHRYFGESRPEPTDWSHLTIRQMADDEHAILAALRTIYAGPVLTTGGSKGGMTATYHRRFYPGDVDGTVPYVAPLSFGVPDPRYAAFLDTLGPPACRAALHDAAIAMLHRRAALLARAEAQAADRGLRYTRISLDAALESAIAGMPWTFWQYTGVSSCTAVPASDATDDELWEFLEDVAPVSDNDDATLARFEPYLHQAYAQLGYPDDGLTYPDGLLRYGDRDYDGAFPAGALPAYDGGAAMRDIDAFVQGEGERLLFVYGEWDPWTGGAYALGAARDSLRVVEPQGTHRARLAKLAPADRDAAFAKLTAWTGVTPTLPRSERALRAVGPAEPRLPSVIARVRARIRSRGDGPDRDIARH